MKKLKEVKKMRKDELENFLDVNDRLVESLKEKGENITEEERELIKRYDEIDEENYMRDFKNFKKGSPI